MFSRLPSNRAVSKRKDLKMAVIKRSHFNSSAAKIKISNKTNIFNGTLFRSKRLKAGIFKMTRGTVRTRYLR